MDVRWQWAEVDLLEHVSFGASSGLYKSWGVSSIPAQKGVPEHISEDAARESLEDDSTCRGGGGGVGGLNRVYLEADTRVLL